MADEGRSSRLGRGLAALIGDAGTENPASERGRTQRRVPIESIRANPRNPRRTFAESDIDELAASIRERGVIQPVVVRGVRGDANTYEIIAGERRWRASQKAGLHDVPVVIVEASDREALELAIIENVQRTDLNPIEEALGYQTLADQFGHVQEEISRIVGKSRSHVANMLRMLKLPDQVKAYIQDGKLTAGHARMLISQPDPVALAEAIVKQGLNVRQVENLAREKGLVQPRAQRKPKTQKDADTVALEKRLSDALGLRVVVEDREGAGAVHVHYSTLEQLDEVTRRLERGG